MVGCLDLLRQRRHTPRTAKQGDLEGLTDLLCIMNVLTSARSGLQPTDDPESRTTEPRPEFQPIPDTTFLEDLAAGLGIRLRYKARKAASVTEDKAAEATSTLEQMLGMKVPKFTAAVAPPPKFEFQDRPLNQEERNGAYVLAGILGGGLLLGGLGKNGAKKEEGNEHKDEKKTKH